MRTALAALLLTAALPLTAAEAHHYLDGLPDAPVEGCRYQTFSQETVTGSEWQGYAYGYAVRGATDRVSVSCVVKVNGAEAGRVDGDTTAGAAFVAGRLTFAASDVDVVTLCRVVTVNGAATETCPRPVYGPPEDFSVVQPFFDHLGEVLAEADAVYCPVFSEHAGSYGPVTVTGGGDVYYDGALLWDCPPWAGA